MKKVMYFGVVFVLLAGIMAAFANRGQQVAVKVADSRKILYYVDPMHPAYKSDKPGIAPDCGMKLEPVYETVQSATTHTSGLAPIASDKQQLIGVQIAPAQVSSGTYTLRLFGRVAAEESRVYKLNAGIEGYVQDVSDVTAGSVVKKDQVLGTFSAPNAAMAVQSYLLNLGAEDRFKKSASEGSPEGQSLAVANSNIQQRVQQLRNIGISVSQIAEMKRTREAPDTIKILSPADGIILNRDASPGQKFDRGAEWFRIADIGRVWIIADVPQADLKHLRPGAHAQVSLLGTERTVAATVGEIVPQFDGNTGTAKVRLLAENPGYLMRPGMPANVELKISVSSVVAVPIDAVIDSGLKKTVFVEQQDRHLVGREVETGRRFDNRVEITRGLVAGERIVISGAFMVASESRLHGVSN